MKDKPFKTIDEQIEYLNDVKKISCLKEVHRIPLIKIGYFNLVNAYKSPFVETKEILPNSKTKHIYHKFTSLDQLISVYEFDDQLRKLIFSVLLSVEQELKNNYAYIIGQDNGDTVSWNSPDYYNPSANPVEVQKLINDIVEKQSKNAYGYHQHYTKKYHELPIWIVMKGMMFSDFIDLIKLARPSTNERFCKIYGITKMDGSELKIDFRRLISMLQFIRVYRNACAHNERTFYLLKSDHSSKRSKGGFNDFIFNPKRYTKDICDVQLIDLLVSLKYFVDKDEYSLFIHQIIDFFEDLETCIPKSPYEKILSLSGIKLISDLENLADLRPYSQHYSIL
jgi:abortive infection bacteriophage resistance protein